MNMWDFPKRSFSLHFLPGDRQIVFAERIKHHNCLMKFSKTVINRGASPYSQLLNDRVPMQIVSRTLGLAQ